MNQANEPELIRQVVRGERNWAELKMIGAEISLRDGVCEVEYAGNALAVPELIDLALGFQAYHDRSSDLREWAKVILAGSGFLDLGGLESRPAGETLIEALWDASTIGQVDEAAWAVIQRLTGGTG